LLTIHQDKNNTDEGGPSSQARFFSEFVICGGGPKMLLSESNFLLN